MQSNAVQVENVLKVMNKIADAGIALLVTDPDSETLLGNGFQIAWDPGFAPTKKDIKKMKKVAKKNNLQFIRHHGTQWDDETYPAILVWL